MVGREVPFFKKIYMDMTDNAEGNGQQRLVVRNYWTGHTGVGESRGI